MKQKKSNLHKDILFVIISSFIVVIIWIGLNIHHVMVTSTIEEEIQLHLTPINGAFDTQIIQQTKNRPQVTPLYEKDKTQAPVIPITPLPPQNTPVPELSSFPINPSTP